jgi:hypothetical protein
MSGSDECYSLEESAIAGGVPVKQIVVEEIGGFSTV